MHDDSTLPDLYGAIGVISSEEIDAVVESLGPIPDLPGGDDPIPELDLQIEALPGLDALLEAAASTTGKIMPTRPARKRTAGTTGRTTRISLRVPTMILTAFRCKARDLGIGYQTLIVETLRAELSR